MRLLNVFITAVFAGSCACAVGAAPSPDANSPALQKLLDCRQIGEATQRLACYDQQAGIFAAATAKKDIVVMDRAQIAETRRGLFGFPLPHIALFESHDDERADKDTKVGKIRRKDQPTAQENRLETTVKALHKNGAGLWVLVLEDDAIWEEVEAGRDANTPRPGMRIVIKRASMGTYFAAMRGGISMRIRRVS